MGHVFRSLVASAVVTLAAAAFAHGGGVLDLEAIEAHVASRVAGASGPEWRHYAALERTLDRPSRRGLVSDIVKLTACVRAVRGPLAADAELNSLVIAAADDANALVGGEHDDLTAIARLLERRGERVRVDRMRDAADDILARARIAPSELGYLAGLRRAAARFAAAEKLAQRFVARQARRNPPGQPVAKGPSGTITTYAGSGVQGQGTEGTAARATPFYFPFDVTTDPATGLVLVVDSNTHRIRRIDADGRVRTVAGSGFLGDTTGPALTARLHHPSSVAFDPTNGDLLVCGWHSARILRLGSATGEIAYAAGSGDLAFSGDDGPAVDAELDYPSNVTFLSDGSWLVADAGNLRIRRVSAEGTITTIAGSGARGGTGDGGAALEAAFDFPPGEAEGPVGRIAVDPTERFVYVADTANHRIRRIDLAENTIDAFAGDGTAAWAGDDGAREAASFVSPVDVDCDGAGNVYVCDRGSSTVRRIDVTSGLVTTIAGSGVPGYAGDGLPGGEAKLDAPQGIHVDRVRGRVYVADTLNSVVRVVWE